MEENIEGEDDKRLATLTQADELKKKKLQEEKLKSLVVVNNAKRARKGYRDNLKIQREKPRT